MGVYNSVRELALKIVSAMLVTWGVFATSALAIEVHTSRSGDLVEVHASALVSAPLSVVWSTLTDYDRLSNFIPGLLTSKVIARNGSTVTVAQTGEAHFLFFSVPIEVTVESTERPPYLEVKRIAGTLRQLYGRYEVTESAGQVQLRWTGAIEPESKLPPLIGEALMRKSIREQFTGMVREIERKAACKC
jgi:carbon monoxide dehydrogenase subunit G